MSTRVLLAYVTAGGATKDYAQAIAETLRSRGDGVDLVDLKREKPGDLSPYSAVIVGTGVRMGMVYRKARRFLRRRELQGKKVAIFLSSGIAIEDPEKSRSKFLTPLVEKLGLRPVMYDAFPGRMPGDVAKSDDRTDPDIARKWAERLAERLSSSEAEQRQEH
jgi:menaquinone-dependent protoporphyrinogen oxidase